jgi:hypothetical protein
MEMGFRGPRAEPARAEVFRPRRVLAAFMIAAGVLWVGVLVYLLRFQEVPLRTWLSTAFFVVFFSVAATYYARTAVILDAAGVTFRGMIRTQRLRYAEIRKVDILPGPVTVYSVRGPRQLWHFTSFFAKHQHLVDLLVERAGLGPVRGLS